MGDVLPETSSAPIPLDVSPTCNILCFPSPISLVGGHLLDTFPFDSFLVGLVCYVRNFNFIFSYIPINEDGPERKLSVSFHQQRGVDESFWLYLLPSIS